MLNALPFLPFATKYATTGAAFSSRSAFSGDQFRVAGTDAEAEQTSLHGHLFDLRGERVDGGGGHRAAAAPPVHHDERHAAAVGGEQRLRFRRADETRPESRGSARVSARRRRACRADGRGRSAHCRSRRRCPPDAAATIRARPPSACCRVRARARARRGSSSVQITSLFAGRRARVMPSATMRASHRIGAPGASAVRPAAPAPGGKLQVVDRRRPCRTRESRAPRVFRGRRGCATRFGLRADRRERLAIDLLTVADVIKHRGGSGPGSSMSAACSIVSWCATQRPKPRLRPRCVGKGRSGRARRPAACTARNARRRMSARSRSDARSTPRAGVPRDAARRLWCRRGPSRNLCEPAHAMRRASGCARIAARPSALMACEHARAPVRARCRAAARFAMASCASVPLPCCRASVRQSCSEVAASRRPSGGWPPTCIIPIARWACAPRRSEASAAGRRQCS